MDLDDAGRRVTYLIRDRDGKYPAMVDQVLADADHDRAQRRPDASDESDHGTVDPNLPPRPARPDTDLQPGTHLLHALREYQRHHNNHRPHQGIATARPLQPVPEPITDPATLTRLRIRRHDRLGGLLHEYD